MRARSTVGSQKRGGPKNRYFRFCIVASIALIASIRTLPLQARTSAQTYVTKSTCDGFPRLQIKTAPDLCVGLVAEHLGVTRGVASIGTDIYVTDMGGWRPNHGRIYKLGNSGRDKPEVLLTGLNEPNTLALGPGGTLYVGEAGKVIRFDPKASNPIRTVKDIVINLPTEMRHPLAALAVAADGSLFINVGSATDHCEKNDGSPPIATEICPETIALPPRGSLLHVMPGDAPVDARTLSAYASGLRNSMALTVLPSGQLLAAVNARDSISRADPSLSEAEFPHDTYVRIEANADYGWPYCFDKNRPSPEYPNFDCKRKMEPTLLLPAHAAPLGMVLYVGNKLPGLNGQIVMTYHGYRATGHRIVALAIDDHGNPLADPRDIVNGWNYFEGGNPQGAPVSLFEAHDGSLLITEDHNGTLLRLSHE